MIKYNFIITLTLLLFLNGFSYAQEEKKEEIDINDFFDMSIEELLNMETSVASNQTMTPRESPGIISVISKEEIMSSGARDLVDIINLVPGFGFGAEVNEAIGISTRGIYALEGKILILIDGVELNESLFGTILFNNYISADQIEKIEIIRGPGSAMYGGSAELAVIRITTISADMNGVWGRYTPSLNKGDFNHKMDAGVGKQYDDWGFSIAGTYKEANRSNETYHNAGTSYEMADSSAFINPYYLNLSFNYKDLKVRFVQDNYHYQIQDFYGIHRIKHESIFKNMLGSIEYDLNLGEKLIITPSLKYKRHAAWSLKVDDEFYRNFNGDRVVADITTKYNLSENLLITGGVNYFWDHGFIGEQTSSDPNLYFSAYGGDSEFALFNYAAFAQLEMNSDYGNFTIGGRYEFHETAKGGFVPRLAYTKIWNKWHTKALISRAFRTPTMQIIVYNDPSHPDIKRESTTAFELEVGRQISDIAALSVNAYHMTMDDPIYYIADIYKNGDRLSTYGAEAELQVIHKLGRARFGYGHYIAGEQGVDLYASDEKGKNASMPTSKFSYNISAKIIKDFSLNVNGFVTSSTRSYKNYEPFIYEGQQIVNLFLHYKIKSIDISVGVSDLLNAKEQYIPTYNNGMSGVPSMSREFILKVGYTFTKKKKN